MTLRSTAKRWTYLVHRWLGIGGCLLMLLWFVSGMVMLFIGYPKLTPGERLAALPALGDARGWQGPSILPAAVQAEPESVALTTLRGEPAYVVRSGNHVGPGRHIPARPCCRCWHSAPKHPLHSSRAAKPSWVRRAWRRTAGRIRAHWTCIDRCIASRWVARSRATCMCPRVPVKSCWAPRMQQRWNYVGAWLHWLYFLRMQSVDPVWTWVVIALSALCTVAAISGIVVGVWRLRFRGHYRSGAKTPYVEPWMRWHHLLGLMASAFVFTWIFSGLMSMNPLGVFSSTGEAIDVGHYRGGAVAVDGALGDPAKLLAVAEAARFQPVEIQWRRIGGELFAVLLDGRGDTRIVSGGNGHLHVARWLPTAWLQQRARALSAAPMQGFVVQHASDAYFYPRAPEAMNGAAVRRFPVAVVDFGDAEATRVYLDLATGDPLLTMGHRERLGRWLFYFLHSWDLPAMLRQEGARLAVLLLLSAVGTALCATATVIGYRRLRMKLRRRRR